ncbi:MAG: FHIPEP family type III secretion protein, partial [Steroidobacteraceae bacterium]
LGYFARGDRGRAKTFDPAGMPAMLRDGGQLAAAAVDEHAAQLAVPLRLRLAPNLRTVLSPAAFDTALEREKSALTQELGLPFPGLRMSFDESLANGQFAVDVQELQVVQGNLQDDKVVSLATRDAALPAVGSDPKVSPEETLAVHIAWAVRRHADAFVGMQEVHALLARASSQLPDLVTEAQRVVPLQRITDVLRRLVQEGVSIRYLREICESLIAWGPREKDIVMLVEYVRVDLGRFIARRFVDARNNLRALVLDGEAEKMVRESIQQGAGGSFLALTPEGSQALTAGADSVLMPLRAENTVILLAPMDVRRYLKKFLGTRFPNLVVLSFQELPPHVQIQPIGKLALHYAPQRRSA